MLSNKSKLLYLFGTLVLIAIVTVVGSAIVSRFSRSSSSLPQKTEDITTIPPQLQTPPESPTEEQIIKKLDELKPSTDTPQSSNESINEQLEMLKPPKDAPQPSDEEILKQLDALKK